MVAQQEESTQHGSSGCLEKGYRLRGGGLRRAGTCIPVMEGEVVLPGQEEIAGSRKGRLTPSPENASEPQGWEL